MDTYRKNLELNIAGVASQILSKSISLHGHACLTILVAFQEEAVKRGRTLIKW